MNRTRHHNALLALAVGAVLGVTGWALAVREPALFRIAPVVRELPVPAPVIEEEVTEPVEILRRQRRERRREQRRERRGNSRTERMIESGALSDHRADYWEPVEEGR